MEVYVVFKTAIYRHECGGVFTTKELAIAAAKKLRDGEVDGHHRYEVIPFILNSQTTQAPLITKKTFDGRDFLEGGQIYESDAIFIAGPKNDTDHTEHMKKYNIKRLPDGIRFPFKPGLDEVQMQGFDFYLDGTEYVGKRRNKA